MQEPKKPIGDFIINNSKGTQTENGVYYHYTEVCRLLKLYEKQLLIHSVVSSFTGKEKTAYLIGYNKGLKEKAIDILNKDK